MKQSLVLPLFLVLCASSCQTNRRVQVAPNPETHRVLSLEDRKAGKQIEIYFDGTANDWRARTNVRRRFEMVASLEDPQYPCCYVEGVGVRSLSGKLFGVGMKTRVMDAYEFLAHQWKQGDKILIFGFSRGAFEARMLAGMLAHCSLPDDPKKAIKRGRLDEIWDLCRNTLKDPEDGAPTVQQWDARLEANRRRTASVFNDMRFHSATPPIDLLAVWDTVPGPLFTKLDEYGVPRRDHPQWYKVRPYPNTKAVVHALALNERRSKFSPLLVGSPIDPDRTKVYEVWFPGAHSDIGGGYSDSNDMAGITFNWVHKVMFARGLTKRNVNAYSDACSIMHHPEASFPSNLGSKNKRRVLPEGSFIDNSVFVRANGESHREDGTSHYVPYAPVIEVKKRGTQEVEEVAITSERRRTAELRRKALGPLLQLYDVEGTVVKTNSSKVPLTTMADLKVETISVKAPEASEAAKAKANLKP